MTLDKHIIINKLLNNPNPEYTLWEEAHDIVANRLLSKDELISRYGILTETAYNLLLRYDNYRSACMFPPIESYGDINNPPYSVLGNIDVIPIGITESASKTGLIAAILSVGYGTYLRHTEEGWNYGGTAYAEYLVNSIRSNKLYYDTCMGDLFVVNAKFITTNNKNQGISFIDYPGERLYDFIEEPYQDKIINDFSQILFNNNKKIILIGFNPNLKHWNDNGGLVSADVHMTQDELLSEVVSTIFQIPEFIKNVISIHVIISGYDKCAKGINDENINMLYKRLKFISVLNKILATCVLNYSNSEKVDIYPFSLGRFMIGGTYSFNQKYALQLLNVLRTDIESYLNRSDSHNSFKNRIFRWFNS